MQDVGSQQNSLERDSRRTKPKFTLQPFKAPEVVIFLCASKSTVVCSELGITSLVSWVRMVPITQTV